MSDAKVKITSASGGTSVALSSGEADVTTGATDGVDGAGLTTGRGATMGGFTLDAELFTTFSTMSSRIIAKTNKVTAPVARPKRTPPNNPIPNPWGRSPS